MLVKAERMAAGGRCVARMDGKAVLVSGVLPGETAEVKVTARHKDFDEAEIVNLLEASPYRVEPACPAAFECGGCSLMIAAQEGQRKFKAQVLRDLLKKFHCEYDGTIEEIASPPFEYRSRFQFHKGERGSVGFRAKRSGRVIPLHDCPVAVPEVRRLLASGQLEGLARSSRGERFSVFSFGGKTLVEGAGGFEFSLDFCGKRLAFDIRSFFQSNVPAFEKAAKAVFADFLEGSAKGGGKRKGAFLDLYGGCGVFSLLASDFFEELFIVEENAASCIAAKANIGYNAARGVALKVFAMKDSEWARRKEASGAFGAAVIDPPRGGIGKAAMQWLLGAKIGKMAYLSCNAPTFARDAGILASGGWALRRLILCDFYPQTPHMEALGFFSFGE